MRLLFVLPKVAPGGAERSMINLINYFINDYEIKLIVFDNPNNNFFYEIHSKVKIEYLNLLNHTGVKNFKAIIEKIKRIFVLRKNFQYFKPKIIISFLDTTNIYCLLANIGLDGKNIISERIDLKKHNTGLTNFYLKKILYKYSSFCIVQTNRSKNYFNNFKKINIKIIPNYFNINIIKKFDNNIFIKKNQKRKKIISVGRLTYQKGFDLLIDSFYDLSNRYTNWDLIIFGEGELKQSLQNKINKYNLTDRVFLKGLSKNIYKEYLQSDILAFTSRYEGFPNVLGEAMLCGLPSIGFSNVSGVEELIIHKINGFQLDYDDPINEIKKYLSILMSDSILREKYSHEAKTHIKKWSSDKILDKWKDLFDQLK